MMTEPEFADGLDVEYERKLGVKGDMKVFDLSSVKNDATIYWDVESCRKNRLRGEDTKIVFMFILSVGMLVLKRSIEYQDGDVT